MHRQFIAAFTTMLDDLGADWDADKPEITLNELGLDEKQREVFKTKVESHFRFRYPAGYSYPKDVSLRRVSDTVVEWLSNGS